MHRIFVIIAYLIQLSRAISADKCGYAQCDLGRPGFLNVHLIPHTHDDVGWLKTIDQYYYGYADFNQKAGVQYILDSVIQSLVMNTHRKFTYVEMAFFQRWWKNQNNGVKEIVKHLVRTGQLEFALGGWSMNDEAVVHYSDSVDQLTRGVTFLNATFGDCGRPRTAWQIDAFGHARDQANIFIEAGFDAVFFQRMDFRERKIRLAKKLMEVIWKPDQFSSQRDSPGLFTHMLFQSYCSPPGFCFDSKCNDPPIIDDPSSPDYNVGTRVEEFINYVKMVANSYVTNHIFVPMGCDFTFENANQNFVNIDRLISNVNKLQNTMNSKVHLLYSSPTCYTKAVNDAFSMAQTISHRTGDFFPYASNSNTYWTGYFTSRPALKYFVRKSSSLLTVVEQVHALAPHVGAMKENNYSNRTTTPSEIVDSLRRIMGILQHHDAVTGTEKQHVANDYSFRLAQAADRCQNLITAVADYYFSSSEGSFKVCDKLNISICQQTTVYTELDATIALYNPLGWPLTSVWLRIPVHVKSRDTRNVQVQIIDLQTNTTLGTELMKIPLNVERIPERLMERHKANMEILVQAGSLENPLKSAGFSLFNLKFNHVLESEPLAKDLSSTLQPYSLFVNDKNLPTFIFRTHSNEEIKVTVEMMQYSSMGFYQQTSGAYTFRPTGEAISFSNVKCNPIIENSLVREVFVEFSEWASLTARLYRNNRMEVDWVVGPLPKLGEFTTEVIIRYRVSGDENLEKSNGVFFTDSLGRNLIQRERNGRPDWGLNHTYREFKHIEGNYYPILNRIMLKGRGDQPSALAIYTDRAQGGSSLSDGEVELMIHRATIQDDNLGVGEPLIERGAYSGLVVRGTHTLLLGKLGDVEMEDTKLAQEVSRSVLPLFKAGISPSPIWSQRDVFSILAKPLPIGVHLLTFTKWPIEEVSNVYLNNTQILVRLENIGVNYLSAPLEVNIDDQFVFGKADNMTELTLVANQLRIDADRSRLIWPTDSLSYSNIRGGVNNHKILLNPGEIKTLLIEFEEQHL